VAFHSLGEKNGNDVGMMCFIVLKNAQAQNKKASKYN
jgi:hypothetical protein